MRIPFYQIDAFTSSLFSGNPAGVCPLQAWLPAYLMQKIAAENNLAETAFFIPKDENFEIRWFTPEVEVSLCGHATLSAAHVLYKHLDYPNKPIEFQSKSGILTVFREGDKITLDFPADFCDPIIPDPAMIEAIGKEPVVSYKGKTDFLLIYSSEEEIRQLKPDFSKLYKVDARGIIVSARGDTADFVSRFFAPKVGINEDPVTGSAHTTLTPYWSRELVKNEMKAMQLSKRGGELWLKMKGNRVEISGNSVTYLEGEIETE